MKLQTIEDHGWAQGKRKIELRSGFYSSLVGFAFIEIHTHNRIHIQSKWFGEI